jgi:hypothetical protein
VRSAPARLRWSTRTGRRADGHRRSGHTDSGPGLRTPIAATARRHGHTRHCGRGHWTPLQRPHWTAGSGTVHLHDPAGRRRPPQAQPSDAEACPPRGTVPGLIKLASSLPWIGGPPRCYPPFLQVVLLRRRCSYVLSLGSCCPHATAPSGTSSGTTSRPTPALNNRWVRAPMAGHCPGWNSTATVWLPSGWSRRARTARPARSTPRGGIDQHRCAWPPPPRVRTMCG